MVLRVPCFCVQNKEPIRRSLKQYIYWKIKLTNLNLFNLQNLFNKYKTSFLRWGVTHLLHFAMNWKLYKVTRPYNSLQSLLCSHQCRREGGEEQTVLASLQRSPAEGFPIASDLPDKASDESVFRTILLRTLPKKIHYSLLQQIYTSGKSPKTYTTSFVAGLPKDCKGVLRYGAAWLISNHSGIRRMLSKGTQSGFLRL